MLPELRPRPEEAAFSALERIVETIERAGVDAVVASPDEVTGGCAWPDLYEDYYQAVLVLIDAGRRTAPPHDLTMISPN